MVNGINKKDLSVNIELRLGLGRIDVNVSACPPRDLLAHKHFLNVPPALKL
jgi:hypothetical protein